MKATLVRALEESGTLLMRYWTHGFSTSVKPDNSLVTEADLAAEKMITRIIRERFPDHGIIGEEGGGSFKDRTWIIDPIDGTALFAHGLPEWGTLIALMEDGEIVLAGMHMPALKRMYLAEKGKGATCNGKPIRVCEETRLTDALVWFGTYVKTEEESLREGAMYARLVLAAQYVQGSNGPYMAGTVADGRAGVIVNLHAKVWDVAAASLIIQEAGGIVTDDRGEPHAFGEDLAKNYPIVAGNRALHAQALLLLKRSGGE